MIVDNGNDEFKDEYNSNKNACGCRLIKKLAKFKKFPKYKSQNTLDI